MNIEFTPQFTLKECTYSGKLVRDIELEKGENQSYKH